MNGEPNLLEGKRALVTGAGAGIGRAIALRLARRDYLTEDRHPF